MGYLSVLPSSFQDYGTLGSVQTESEYERRMMSVFNHVLEEVEGLSRKHPPVSYLVRSSNYPGLCSLGTK